MKSVLSFVLIFISFYVSAQDRILKTDGTVIKGKVISFQNNRLVVMQDDETEMTLPRKAVAEIKFDYLETMKTTAKSVEPPVQAPAPVAYSTVPKPAKKVVVEQPKSTETFPGETLEIKKVGMQSPGEINGLESRAILSSAPLKEKPIGAGRIAVTVCLNADGIVTNAKFKPVGSSTFDSDLISLAVQNARTFRFEKGGNEDCGVITYKFNLD